MALKPKMPSGPPVVPITLPVMSAREPERSRISDSAPHVRTARPISSRVPEQGATGLEGPLARESYFAHLTDYEQMEILSHVVYYPGHRCHEKVRAPVPGGYNSGYDDEKGDYHVVLKDHVMYRYELLAAVGRGSFGQVVKAADHKTGAMVALKIIRNKRKFHQQAEIEIRILAHLRDRDPEGKYGIVRMVESFSFRQHTCIVYELLSMNLYEYMKLNKFYPMPLQLVKKIAASILISLAYMLRENVIHCDLKPENILLRQVNKTGIKVIDLGSACFETEKAYTYIQSRFYRAPEVILGISYSRRIDLWSYACVLCELATGYPLFAGEDEAEQLACIMEVLGAPRKTYIEHAPRKTVFFESHNDGFVLKLQPNGRKKVRTPGTKTLAAVLSLEEDNNFVGFINSFLHWEAEERPSPEVAMRHPWICDTFVGITPKVPPHTRRPLDSSNRRPGSKPMASLRPTAPALPSITKRK